MVQGVMHDLNVANPEKYKIYHIFLISGIILFPICLLRTVNSLRYGTLISIVAVVYSSLVLLVELFIFWDTKKAAKEIRWFVLDGNFFSAFGITFFAYYCQISFFPILENLLKLDEIHVAKVSLFYL